MVLGQFQDRPLVFTRLTLCNLNPPRATWRLDGRVIRLHAFLLDAPPDVRTRCEHWLSANERARAAGFRFTEDRAHFVVAHGYLRYVLGAYCDRAPDSLEFCRAPAGKPFLAPSQSPTYNVTFSLTHSHGRALVAVASGFEVGVDLEPIRPSVNYLALARRFFAPEEARLIETQTEERARKTFFRHWVAKEAVLKAQGSGLHAPLHQCALDFSDGDTARVRHQADSEPLRQFCARILPLEDPWAGAVAAQGPDWQWRVA